MYAHVYNYQIQPGYVDYVLNSQSFMRLMPSFYLIYTQQLSN